MLMDVHTISPLAENPVADWLAMAGIDHLSGLAEAVENQVGRNLAQLQGLSDAEIDAMLAPLSMGRVPMKEVKTALMSLRGQVIVDNGAALDEENSDEEAVIHVLSPAMDATPAEEAEGEVEEEVEEGSEAVFGRAADVVDVAATDHDATLIFTEIPPVVVVAAVATDDDATAILPAEIAPVTGTPRNPRGARLGQLLTFAKQPEQPEMSSPAPSSRIVATSARASSGTKKKKKKKKGEASPKEEQMLPLSVIVHADAGPKDTAQLPEEDRHEVRFSWSINMSDVNNPRSVMKEKLVLPLLKEYYRQDKSTSSRIPVDRILLFVNEAPVPYDNEHFHAGEFQRAFGAVLGAAEVELRVQLVPPTEWLAAIVASTSKQASKANEASRQVEYGFEAY